MAADLDQDGWIDLFVANDMSPNYLFKNRGGFRFEELGMASGVAGNASGGSQAGRVPLAPILTAMVFPTWL